MSSVKVNKNIKIAIAEDHVGIRRGLISLLREFENLEVLFDVSNGMELLDKLKHSRPDVILLDINMPLMDGRDTLKKIKIEFPNIKVIVISNNYSFSYLIDFFKNGASAFLKKNTDIEIIIEAIQASYEVGYYFDQPAIEIVGDYLPDYFLR